MRLERQTRQMQPPSRVCKLRDERWPCAHADGDAAESPLISSGCDSMGGW